MNRLADALDIAAEALAALAHEYRASQLGDDGLPDIEGQPKSPTRRLKQPQVAAPVAVEAPTEASWTETDDWIANERAATIEEAPAGSAAVCPAHGEPYRDGKFGPYCASLGTDPKWTNQRGYCQITPKNAAAYLRQKAAR